MNLGAGEPWCGMAAFHGFTAGRLEGRQMEAGM
jgi:hypothetical protein